MSETANFYYPSARAQRGSRLLSLLLFLGISLMSLSAAFAFKLENKSVPSQSMGKSIATIVVIPDGLHSGSGNVPTLYLLHGYGDNETAWTRETEIGKLADQYRTLVICPNAANSWYFDSPEDPKMRYETFVSSELVDFVDKHYPTIASRGGRAIAGLSMGGHGALFLATRHRDVFGAAVVMSGGVDIRPFPNNWDIKKVLGTIEEHPERWNELNAAKQAKVLKDGDLALSIDCGTNDFFLAVNRELHQQLLEQKVAHDYAERPGEHNWDYWRNAIKYQMLFLSDFFKKSERAK